MSKETIQILMETREKIRARAEEEMDALTRTIEVLQRRAEPDVAANIIQHPQATGPTPSVREMFIAAGEALAEGHEEDFEFTFKQLKDWCLAQWPNEESKIRTGIYSSCKRIVEEGIWESVEHGFKIAQKERE